MLFRAEESTEPGGPGGTEGRAGRAPPTHSPLTSTTRARSAPPAPERLWGGSASLRPAAGTRSREGSGLENELGGAAMGTGAAQSGDGEAEGKPHRPLQPPLFLG